MTMTQISSYLDALSAINAALDHLIGAADDIEAATECRSPEWTELQEIVVSLRRYHLLLSRRRVRCSECGDVYRIADEPAEPLGELTESHGVCPACTRDWERRLEEEVSHG